MSFISATYRCKYRPTLERCSYKYYTTHVRRQEESHVGLLPCISGLHAVCGGNSFSVVTIIILRLRCIYSNDIRAGARAPAAYNCLGERLHGARGRRGAPAVSTRVAASCRASRLDDVGRVRRRKIPAISRLLRLGNSEQKRGVSPQTEPPRDSTYGPRAESNV